MNFFKKIGLLTTLLIPTLFVAAQSYQSYEIYVYDTYLTKTDYAVGETVQGEFTLHNLSDSSQSDLYYVIYSGKYSSNGISLQESFAVSEKVGPIYLNGNSNKKISFSYPLPDYINGEVGVEIVAELKDGTVVGSQNIPITIAGETKRSLIEIEEGSLLVNDQVFGLKTGPTVLKDDTISLSFTLAATENVETLNPSIKLFNRVHNSEVILSKSFDGISTSTTGSSTHTIELPKELEPLVYAGTLKLETSNSSIASDDIFFRYIIGGDIATIRNVDSDKISVKEGEEFITTITSVGVPINITDPESQNELETASVDVSVIGENGIVAEFTGEIDLTKDSIDIPLTAESESENLSYSVTISKDGKILSDYETTLESDKEEILEETEETKEESSLFGNLLIILAGIIIIMITVFIVITKKKKDITAVPLMIIMAGMSIGGWIAVDGAEVVINNARIGNSNWAVWSTSGVHFNAIQSPLPPRIKKYKPGEEFYLDFAASANGCNNHHDTLVVYGPPRDSWSEMSNNIPYNISPNTKYQGEIPSDLKGTLADIEWWKSNGVANDVYGGLSNIYNYTNPSIVIDSYTAPSVPGIYDFYFLIQGDAIKCSITVESYERGESGEKLYDCPKSQKQINYFTLVKQTIEVVPLCNADHTEGELMCINQDEYEYTCNIESSLWETLPTGGDSCIPVCNSDHSEGDSAGESDCGELLWKCLNGTWGKVDNNGNKCVPTCNNDHDEGDLTCINNNEYSYTCNTGSWDTVPTGETCNDTGGGGGSCPILPTNVGSATYNIFDKAGNFVLTDPVPGDDKTPVDIFNQYFKNDLLTNISDYNINNGDESDIQLETSFGDPIIKSLNPALPYGQAIQGSTNDTCSTSICPLSSGDAVYSNNEACTLEKEGENIITNGCYDLGGNTSLKLLTSPNFMNPGEYCTISWCAQGPDAQRCIIVVDGIAIGSGISGTTSYQMGEQSEQVRLICTDGVGGEQVEKIDNCRLHPDWNQF